VKFNEDFASVHAYLCADGYVVRNPPTQKTIYYRAGLRNTNIVLLRDFQGKFKRVFGLKPWLVEGQRCEKGSKEIYSLLTEKFGSFYSWYWSMPKMSLINQRAWLRSYFDCEGWVTCKTHQNRHIGADCVNKIGITQVKDSLELLGIYSKLTYLEKRKIYRLYIYGKHNLIMFDKKIGFLHPSKKDKLNAAIRDFVDYEWVFPNNEGELTNFVKETFNTRGKIKRDNGILRLISNKEINLIRLQKVLKKQLHIESKVNKRTNGIGTSYFELNVNKKDDVKMLVENEFINDSEKEKWLKLKK